MKKQYSLKLFGALLALSGLSLNAQAQTSNPPPKVRTIVHQLRYRAQISSITVGDTLQLRVRAAATDTFSLSIVDTGNVVVQTALVTGGTTNLAALPIGRYGFTLSTLDSVVVGRGHFAVKAPHVPAAIRSGRAGDTLNIFVKADTSEAFTLTISDTSGVVETLTVYG
ncbi:MAG TPA: hypothetical protein VL947_00110, partial [Cytophagales bacterium]|nr:hypothetical protein [Cytophagales bacterium]